MARIILQMAAVVLLWTPVTAGADIYRYRDASGVLHFTNVPTSSKYSLYLKEKPGKRGIRVPGFRAKNTRAFDDTIRKASLATGLDFSLIKAVISAESSFNPGAVSKKGATGLMQIMPGNFNDLDITDPFDPIQNVMGGSRYLKQLLNRYQNRLHLALAAYNAGPDAVDTHNGIPPYPETIAYVHKVMGLIKTYKR